MKGQLSTCSWQVFGLESISSWRRVVPLPPRSTIEALGCLVKGRLSISSPPLGPSRLLPPLVFCSLDPSLSSLDIEKPVLTHSGRVLGGRTGRVWRGMSSVLEGVGVGRGTKSSWPTPLWTLRFRRERGEEESQHSDASNDDSDHVPSFSFSTRISIKRTSSADEELAHYVRDRSGSSQGEREGFLQRRRPYVQSRSLPLRLRS